MKEIKDNSIYLKHILDSMNRIEEYLYGIEADIFDTSSLTQDAVIRQIEIIGEATKRLSDDIIHQYKEVPWRNMAGMRDKLIHDYLGVDINKVWITATTEIPKLKGVIIKILKDHGV